MRSTFLCRGLALASALMLGAAASAQMIRSAGDGDAGPMPVPDLSPTVLRSLEAEYLTPEEGARMRVFHGVAREGDVDTPEAAARAALISGAYDDPALTVTTNLLDRAEALVLAGEAESALTITQQNTTMRGAWIRITALNDLGRLDECIARIDETLGAFDDRTSTSAADVTLAARMLILRIRLAGPEGDDVAGEYETALRLLATARQSLDRLYWPAILVEAKLLQERDNRPQAFEAAQQVLTMCPSSADAWYLLGRLAVDSLDFAGAERVALRLDELAKPGISVHASLVRARAALRARMPDEAEVNLGKALDTMPRHRESLAVFAAAAGVAYDFQTLDERLAQYDEVAPGSPRALFEAGAALGARRQYPQAIRLLTEASRRQPAWADPLIELGLTQLQAGEDVDALGTLSAAFELDPFNVRADNSLRLVREVITWPTIETEHFVVRYRPGESEVLATEMGPVLEEIHDVVTGAQPGGIDHEPAQKTLIELAPDHASFSVRITGTPDIWTMAAATGPVIAVDQPRAGPGHLGTYDWPRVLRHEYTHTVTLSRTKYRIPHWFTEASAVYLELAPRDFPTVMLLARAVETGTLFDLDRINNAFSRPEGPNDRAQAYAQGHWMYEYIVERWGPDAPLEMMDLYAAGADEGAAFDRVLGLTRETFMSDFTRYANDALIEWGVLLPDGEPGVRDMLVEKMTTDEESRQAASRRLDALLEGLGEAATGGAPAAGALDASLPLPKLTPELIRTWLAERPEHPELLELAIEADLGERGGAPDESMIPLLERYATARSVDPMPHRNLARIYLESADPSMAIPHLEYLDARETTRNVFALELAKRYAGAEQWGEALNKALRASRFAPFDADHRELAATMAIKAGRLDVAEAQIEALVMLEPGQRVHEQRLEAVRKLRERQGN